MTVLGEVLTTVFYIVNRWHGCHMKRLCTGEWIRQDYSHVDNYMILLRYNKCPWTIVRGYMFM